MAGSHILVVDDSHVISSLLDDFLTEKGFRVSVAGTAEEAYSKIRESIPDLIVLDLVLPDVHGLQFCRVLRSDPQTHQIPVIMATAKAIEVRDKVEGLRAGADDYVIKPFELTELYERINAILRRAGLERDRIHERLSSPHADDEDSSKNADERHGQDSSETLSLLTGIFVEPTRTFASLSKESPGGAFQLSVWIVVLTSALTAMGRLLTAGPRLGAEFLGSLLFVLGVLSVWMVFGGVFTLLISLMGQKGSFKPVASVIGLGCLPLMLERFLGLIYIFSGGRPGEFSADPTLIFPRFLSKTPLGFCVRGLDVFLLWSAALVGIGFSVLYRCGKKKSIVMTICFWVFTLGVFWVWDSLSGTHH